MLLIASQVWALKKSKTSHRSAKPSRSNVSVVRTHSKKKVSQQRKKVFRSEISSQGSYFYSYEMKFVFFSKLLHCGLEVAKKIKFKNRDRSIMQTNQEIRALFQSRWSHMLSNET